MQPAESLPVDRPVNRIRTAGIAVAALVVLGALLRLYQIGVESFWFDEIIMVLLTRQGTDELVAQLFRTARAPLYPLLGHFWVQLFGTSEAAVRSMSAVFGSLSIPLVYVIGRRMFSQKVGFIGALLMTLSVYQVYYSQEYRYYSLVILITLLAVLFFLYALDDGRARNYLLYAAFSILLFYTHPLAAALFIGALGFYFLALLALAWKRYRPALPVWVASQVLIVVGASPTLVLRLVRSADNMVETAAGVDSGLAPWWLEAPPVWEPVRTVVNFMILGVRYLEWLPALLAAALFAVGLLLYVRGRGRRQWSSDLRDVPAELSSKPWEWKRNALLLVFWFLGPIVLAYLSSFTVLPMYVERYLSQSAPAMYLLIAVGIVALGDVVPEYLSAGLLALWLALALQQYYVQDIKEQWDEVAAYVESNAEAGDVLAFSSNWGNMQETVTIRQSFDWYFPGDVPACDVNPTGDDASVLSQLEACGASGSRVWLVMRWSDDARVEELASTIQQQDADAGGLLEKHWFVGDVGLYLLGL